MVKGEGWKVFEKYFKIYYLTFDKNTGTITLMPKANRPVAPMSPKVIK